MRSRVEDPSASAHGDTPGERSRPQLSPRIVDRFERTRTSTSPSRCAHRSMELLPLARSAANVPVSIRSADTPARTSASRTVGYGAGSARHCTGCREEDLWNRRPRHGLTGSAAHSPRSRTLVHLGRPNIGSVVVSRWSDRRPGVRPESPEQGALRLRARVRRPLGTSRSTATGQLALARLDFS